MGIEFIDIAHRDHSGLILKNSAAIAEARLALIACAGVDF